VGVKNGYGRDAGTVWYRCALWGNAATAFESSIKKGVKVFIQGDLKHDEYEGKPQFNIDVKGIDTGGGKSDSEQSSGDGSRAGGSDQWSQGNQANSFVSNGDVFDDLSDDVQF
jgi:single-stranded DNA-binding protein